MTSVVDDTPHGSVVAGVDRGDNDSAVLQVAYQLAVDTGRRLVVVHAIRPPVPARFASQDATAGSAAQAVAERRRAADLARVDIETLLTKIGDEAAAAALITIEYADPATLLLAAVQSGDLIVVGARGSHHARSPLLLGTVSQDVAVHSCCPVLLVPAP
jgi:nucleotide-binding universal stress UspA family protein